MSTELIEAQSIAISLFLLSLKKQKISIATLKGYSGDLRAFFEYLKTPGDSIDVATLQKIKPEDIELHLKNLADKGLKYSSIKRASAAIRRFFDYLIDQGILTDNPAKSLTIRSVPDNILGLDHMLSIFDCLNRHQQMGNESDIIRYRRDEVILLLMILYGIRQYQLGNLKLSQLQKLGNDVSLTVRKGFTIKLDGVVLQRLRDYLSIRKSNTDTIFLDVFRKKGVDHSSVRAFLIELRHATRLACSPKILHKTYIHLQQNPGERTRLLQLLGRKTLGGIHGALSNA